MNTVGALYIAGNTPVHTFDARVKLVTLLMLTVTALLVRTWAGIGLVGLLVALLIMLAKLPVRRLVKLSIPLIVLLGFICLFNSLSLSGDFPGLVLGVSANSMVAFMYSARIVILFFASYIVSFTTTAEDLALGFSFMLSPLKKISIPIDDIATMLSLAVRFIPLMADEMNLLRCAQASRGALFDTGGLVKRLSAWIMVVVPLVVSLFRRASKLGQAMEARCYGAAERTSLSKRSVHVSEIAAVLFLLVVCAFACFFL